jgi:hypothetical protein
VARAVAEKIGLDNRDNGRPALTTTLKRGKSYGRARYFEIETQSITGKRDIPAMILPNTAPPNLGAELVRFSTNCERAIMKKSVPLFILESVSWESLKSGDKIVVSGVGILTFLSVRFDGDQAIFKTAEGYEPKRHRSNWLEKATLNPAHRG